MKVAWTLRAKDDLERLHGFLARVNGPAADRAAQSLIGAPARLIETPQIGQRLEEFLPRDVRRFLVGPYEMRYEVTHDGIVVLRLWHAREDR